MLEHTEATPIPRLAHSSSTETPRLADMERARLREGLDFLLKIRLMWAMSVPV